MTRLGMFSLGIGWPMKIKSIAKIGRSATVRVEYGFLWWSYVRTYQTEWINGRREWVVLPSRYLVDDLMHLWLEELVEC